MGNGCRFTVVALLVLMLLPGPIVLAFCVSLEHFWVLYVGLLVLLTWGIFYDILIHFEHWSGHRLLSEKLTRPHIRPNRPILIPPAPVSEGVEIRQGCQFISSFVRALSKLPGGMGRFLPCGIGSHMSRLRHLGWNQCSHGLTSRPLESCHHQCLGAVCGVLGFPELLDGSLKLRFCTAVFTNRFHPRVLPRLGKGIGKRRAVTSGNPLDCRSDIGKRVRLTRKTRSVASSGTILDPGHSTPRRWKRLRSTPTPTPFHKSNAAQG